MNRKQLLILIVLVVVIGGGGIYYSNSRKSSWTGGGAAVGEKLLGNFEPNNVAQIHIQHGTNQLTLAKTDDLWRVRERDDYPANFSQISELLLKLRDLKIVQTEQIGPSQLARLNLSEPGSGTNAATSLELRDASGKPLKTLLLGKEHMRKSNQSMMDGMGGDGGWPDGRYVMTGEKKDSVAVISDPLSNVETKPEEWLNKDFFKVEKPRSIAVTFPDTTNSWKVTRETESGEWQLADAKANEKLDSGKTSSFNYALSSPSFNDVSATSAPLEKPTEISIETFDGFNYAIKVGDETNTTRHLTVTVAADLPKERTPDKDEKPEDKTRLDKEFADAQKKLQDKLAHEKSLEKWTYTVSSWTVESLLKPRHELLAEEKKEEPSSESKVEAGSETATNSVSATNTVESPSGNSEP